MKYSIIALFLLLIIPSSYASVSAGVSALLKTIDGQQLTYRTGVIGQAGTLDCSLEIFSNAKDHIAIYIEDSESGRHGVATGFGNSQGQIIFKKNQVVVNDSNNIAILNFNSDGAVKNVEIRGILPIGSYFKNQCNL